jgi:hypothetical protein
MVEKVEFPFLEDDPLPSIPIVLLFREIAINVDALLDTGATVNVLPYRMLPCTHKCS